MEELLRESACLGNLDGVQKLLQSGTSINSQNSVNGWTALHWASKRGHAAIVQLLLQGGADAEVRTHNGELPIDLATTTDIMKLLNGKDATPVAKEGAKLSFVPNYLANPPFPYYNIHSKDISHMAQRSPAKPVSPVMPEQLSEKLKTVNLSEQRPTEFREPTVDTETTGKSSQQPDPSQKDLVSLEVAVNQTTPSLPLVVRVRVSESGEEDFVEAEVSSPTYHALLSACCQELEVATSDIVRIRKLPNIWVRKDRDVQRMREGQELEVVLKNPEDNLKQPI